MKDRLFYLLLFLLFLSSCAKSIIGTHHVESKGWFTARLDIQDKKKFSYSESHDQASFEGKGTYKISNNQLILNFGNNKAFVSDLSVHRKDIKSDSLIINVVNINDEPFRLHYNLDSPHDKYDKEYFKILKPNDSLNIRLPFFENTEIGIYTKKHRKVSYLFAESGFYTIRHKFIHGPQFDISNTKWIFKILKNDTDSLILEKTFIEGYPILKFKKM